MLVSSRFTEWHDAVVDDIDGNTVKVSFIAFQKSLTATLEDIVPEEHLADDDEDCGVGECLLCTRQLPLTRHHLIPRMMHARYTKKGFTKAQLNDTVDICRACHSTIHRAEDEKTLAARFRTLEALAEHPTVMAWVKFASAFKKTTRWDMSQLRMKAQMAKAKEYLKT